MSKKHTILPWIVDTDDEFGLHAAAPELLDLLKAAVIRVGMANADGDPILSAWLPDARAAIAKAEGSSE